jgi:hypothetical protein
VTHVEFVVEVGGGLSELSRHFVMEGQGLLNNSADLLTHGSLELLEMLSHESTVDSVQRVAFREVNSQEPEPSLESGVDSEGSSSSVHGSNVLSVGDLLHDQLLLIVPMGVIEMLSDQSNSSLGFIGIKLRHVEIVNKVDQLDLSRRSETGSSLLLELRLHDTLQESRISEEIEVNGLRLVVLSSSGELIQKTVNNLGLTTSGVTHKHGRDSNSYEILHDVLRSDGVTGRNGVIGDGSAGVDAVFDGITAEVVPVNEFGVIDIDIVIEDCSLGGELDSLELLTPEFIESQSALVSFLDFKASSHAPDSSEHENEFESLYFVEKQTLEELADAGDLRDELDGHNSLESFTHVLVALVNIVIEESLEGFFTIGFVRAVFNPGLNVGAPLVAIIVRNVQNTGSGDSGRCSVVQISDFKNELHVRLERDTLVGS